MNVELPGDVNDFVKELVVSGRFASEQEAITEGLRLLMSREQLRTEVTKGFKQLDDGEWLDGDAIFDDLHREIDAIEKEQFGT